MLSPKDLIGRRVRKKSGLPFQNGEMVATVDHIVDGSMVYFRETGTWMKYTNVLLDEESQEYDDEAII